MPTTPRGYTYPSGTDTANIPSTLQTLATNIDTDVATRAPIASPTFTGTVAIPAVKFGYTTTATAGATSTLTVASSHIQFFTGTLNQTIVLPVTSTLTTGHSYEIHNNSTGTLTVNSSGGNLVVSIIAGATYSLTCIGTTLTTAADWDADFNGTTSITGTASSVLSASPTFTGTPLSTTAAVDTNTTQIATTAFVVGQAANTAPLIDGTATIGTSLRYARQDHIHPTDTSRAPLASPTFTGTPLSTTAAADTNTTQIATTAYVIGQASAVTPANNGTAAVGTSLRYARADHVHASDTTKANIASPTFTGQVTVPAGTTSAAPVIFQSSALLTTAAGGRMEYDNTAFYLTPSQTAVGGRAVINHSMVYALSATRNLADVNTVQSIFGVGLTVAATTTYEIDMFFGVSTTGTVSNSLGIGFGGTATLTSIGYEAIVGQNATSLGNGSTPTQFYIQVATNSTITSAVATATYRTVRVRGLVRVNASGTFIPQLTYSAASGAIPVVAANSYIKMTPVGSNTVTTIGAWA